MLNCDRREFLLRLGHTVLVGAASPSAFACSRPQDAAPPPPATGPNLLFIMADDLGFADLSIYGRTDYQTPVLDHLAREGVRLTQAYSAAPVCTPTRVALMTGQYPARHEAGLHEPLTTHPTGLPAELPTLPRLLKNAGYQTALVGKWHLGLGRRYHPLRHGFDEFYGHLGAAIDYATGLGTEQLKHDWYDGTDRIEFRGYATDLITERAVRIVSRRRERPFFLSLQYNAPHWPWQAPGDPPYPDSLRWRRGGSPETYARMMRSLDDGIGSVLQALRDAGVEQNTVVIFTSDNGGEMYSDMGPFDGQKMSLSEGGIRVSAFARWPGVIPADTTTDQVAVTMDWAATLLAIGGAKPDAAFPLDGIDLRPQLTGASPSVSRDLFWRITQRRRHRAMRSGDWKYLATEEGEFLFDLASDLGEHVDRSSEAPAEFARLKSLYAEWESEVLPPIPLDPRFAVRSGVPSQVFAQPAEF